MRDLRERLQMLHRRQDVLGRPQPVGEGAGDPGPRVLRLRRSARRRRGRAFRRGAGRPRDRRADRAVRQVPLLQVGPVLDVRGTQYLRFPARGRRRRDGRVHAHSADRDRSQDSARRIARGCGDHRAAVVRDPYGEPWRRAARRRRRDRGRGPARVDDDAGRPPEDAEEARRDRPDRRTARTRAPVRRRRDDQPAARRRARDRPRAHRRLRLRRVHRDDRRAGRREPGARPDPQARPLRRIQRVRRGCDRRLVDHRRPQGARRTRRAPRAILLSGRDRPARAGARHVEGHRHARFRAGRLGRCDPCREIARIDQGAAEAGSLTGRHAPHRRHHGIRHRRRHRHAEHQGAARRPARHDRRAALVRLPARYAASAVGRAVAAGVVRRGARLHRGLRERRAGAGRAGRRDPCGVREQPVRRLGHPGRHRHAAAASVPDLDGPARDR
ncbi:putative Uncharacterized 50.6 kDa protein in the 5\\'region of gyrA and gyrB [Burkholderia cenocepacia]|nr:putative Uncharacterized 50.6 kDa protein in the 5\\'region of gyrA and gyrB [Burkholderia cenocepacia]